MKQLKSRFNSLVIIVLAFVCAAASILWPQWRTDLKAEGYPSIDIFIELTGTCGGNTPCYTSIQDGINAAVNGATIAVAQGTYNENISIASSKRPSTII